MIRKFSEEHYEKMMKIVKSQCGKHTATGMARILDLPTCSLARKIKKQGIVFSKKEEKCYFCLNPPRKIIYEDYIYLCMRYKKKEKIFSCPVCNFSAQVEVSGDRRFPLRDARKRLLSHMNHNHQKSIMLKHHSRLEWI